MNLIAIRFLTAPALFSILASCGGGGSEPAIDESSLEIDAVVAALDEADTLIVTPNEAVPTTGIASYAGALLLGSTPNIDEIKSNPSYVANAQLAVGFADSTVTGGFSDFISSSNLEVDGALMIEEGLIQDGNVIGAIAGNIGSANYEGLLVSLLLGENSTTIAGSIAIRNIQDDGDQLFGSFSADEQ